MGNETLGRLASVLDSESMAATCRSEHGDATKVESLFRLLFEVLRGWLFRHR